LDQPAKVLLVQSSPGKSFYGPLKLQQHEARGHELKNDWTVFDLGPQPGDARGEDTPMVKRHRLSKKLTFRAECPWTSLRHQASFVEEFVPLQDKFFVPGSRIRAEGGVYALRANRATAAVAASGNPPLAVGQSKSTLNMGQTYNRVSSILESYVADSSTRKRSGEEHE
jgi:hypothetical protein